MRHLSFFPLLYYKPWNGCFSWEKYEIKGRAWSYVSILPLNECGEIFNKESGQIYRGKSKLSRDAVRSPALLYHPAAWAEPSSLFSNVMKYLVCCFKETQTKSGFCTKQTWSLRKVTILLPMDLTWVSGSFKL